MYQPLPTIAEFSKKNKKKKSKSKSKRKSAPLPLPEMEMGRPAPKGRDLGMYDVVNLPLRGWSNLQQTSREARSWINLLRGRNNSRRPLL